MGFFDRQRRNILREEVFPEREAEFLARRVPLVTLLDEDERRRLHGDIKIFLAEKRFEGCADLEITREMELAVAAQACLLLLNLETDYFPRCESILIYPSGFLSYESQPIAGGIVTESEEARIGESWAHGAVILSWDAIERDLAGLTGRNVVLHEFAHQLDQSDGAADGWPTPMAPAVERRWLDVMGPAFKAHVSAVGMGRHTAISAYGATNPAEFFAVLTELFFERPAKLQSYHPAIYAVLSDYYQQDPRARQQPAG